MGVACLVQNEIPEGKSAQQVIDVLQKKIELAGAERSGNWSVECETYYSSQNLENAAKMMYLLHSSDYPSVSFVALDNNNCVVAERGMDSLIAKLKAFYAPRKTGKIEAKGLKYDFGDFSIRIGTMSQGNNLKGVISEFEYAACSDMTQCWELLLEFVYSFVDEKQCQVTHPPKTFVDTKTKQYSVADKMLQYIEMFKFGKK
eukprot:gene20128-22100_t